MWTVWTPHSGPHYAPWPCLLIGNFQGPSSGVSYYAPWLCLLANSVLRVTYSLRPLLRGFTPCISPIACPAVLPHSSHNVLVRRCCHAESSKLLFAHPTANPCPWLMHLPTVYRCHCLKAHECTVHRPLGFNPNSQRLDVKNPCQTMVL